MDKGSYHIGLVGCGEMGSALFAGITNENKSPRIASVWAASPNCDFSKLHWKPTHTTRDNNEVFANCDFVFWAFPVTALMSVLEAGKEAIQKKRPVIVSMCGAGSLADMRKSVGEGIEVTRIMPNTPTEIGCGMTAITDCPSLEALRDIMKSTGELVVIEESEMRQFAVAFSCTPAYNYMTLEALSDAAVHMGFPRELANKLAIYNTIQSCERLRDQPTSASSSSSPVRNKCKESIAPSSSFP